MTLFKPIGLAFLVAAGCARPGQPTPARAMLPVASEPQPAATAAPAIPTPSAIETRTFHSNALGVDKSYVVYLPAGYTATRRAAYPVIYLLHGLGADETWWSKHGALPEIADAVALDAIVVMPDGDDSFYLDWASPVNYDECLAGSRLFGSEADMATFCVKAARYGEYIAHDLVAEVDRNYHTQSARSGRGISGVSMGGYGALVIAMRNTERFGAVASHSGLNSLYYKGPHPYEAGKAEVYESLDEGITAAGPMGLYFKHMLGSDPGYWDQRDPVTLAATLKADALAIYLDCGRQDQLKLQDGTQYLHQKMTELGLPHEFALEDGGHTNEFFHSRLDDGLRFFQDYFGRGQLAPH